MAKTKLKTGDTVIVLSGRDKYKEGEITKIITKDNKALVTNINMVKKHQKATPMQQGGIIDKNMPIHLSNLALKDPKTGKYTYKEVMLHKDKVKEFFAQK